MTALESPEAALLRSWFAAQPLPDELALQIKLGSRWDDTVCRHVTDYDATTIELIAKVPT